MSWRTVRARRSVTGVTLEVFEAGWTVSKHKLLQITVPEQQLIAELDRIGALPKPVEIRVPADAQLELQNEILLYSNLNGNSNPLTTYGRHVKEQLWARIIKKMGLSES